MANDGYLYNVKGTEGLVQFFSEELLDETVVKQAAAHCGLGGNFDSTHNEVEAANVPLLETEPLQYDGKEIWIVEDSLQKKGEPTASEAG